jgi:hypothetical protein
MAADPGAGALGIRVVHHVPGRIRVRVEGAPDPADLLDRLQPVLASLPPVTALRVNAALGSVIIHYAGPMPAWHQPVEHLPAHLALARQWIVPLAVGTAISFALKRGRPGGVWLELGLLAMDTLSAVRRVRRTAHRFP